MARYSISSTTNAVTNSPVCDAANSTAFVKSCSVLYKVVASFAISQVPRETVKVSIKKTFLSGNSDDNCENAAFKSAPPSDKSWVDIVKKAINEVLEENKNLQTEILNIGDGIAISKKI